MQWQPIDTAPRDGTLILGCGLGDLPFICAFVNNRWTSFGRPVPAPEYWLCEVPKLILPQPNKGVIDASTESNSD